MGIKTAHIRVRGLVQGVGFRFFVRRLAHSIGINGWVRNCPDGSVEIMAEGEDGLVNDFIKAVRVGPSFGNVKEMSVDFTDSPSFFTTFEIRFYREIVSPS